MNCDGHALHKMLIREGTLSLSFNVGAAYAITENIFVDARYNLGLSSIAKDFTDEFGDSNSANIKNNVIQFSVGYKF